MTTPPVLSVSQVERFDPEQTGGCQLRWWFEDVRGLRPESTSAHEDGHQGHALLARYLKHRERPGRVRLGKAVNAVIDSAVLPAPGPDLRVEERFSLQDHRDSYGQWVPLDVRRTLWHAGHPWEGFVDLRFRRGDTVTVWDHKFSSDIHARALPADRLLRTVQMPIYALDTLRHWPDATAVNLVHLYVSRRGVESFVRQQTVTVGQVQERAAEIAGPVRQMDAVRGATAQDDVPFNRAACHARTGCPHQFRCNAFRRRVVTRFEMTDEEKAMFGILSEEKPKPPASAEQREMAAFDEYVKGEDPAISKALAQGAVLNLDDIFEPPVASTPKPQPAPTCEVCGEVLTPENSSRLKTGDVKHIGCAKGGINLAGGGALVVDALPTTTTAPKCPDCPHATHEGKACEGKRGRGKCQCGMAVEMPGRVLADGTKVPAVVLSAAEVERLADVLENPPTPVGKAPVLEWPADEARQREEVARAEGAARARIQAQEAETDRVLRTRVADLEDALRTAREIAEDPELGPRGSWTGTLAVNVTVELGPSTLALIQYILKR